ncbi:MAG: fumarylacetoacetate hydrolase family protein [Gammaproteobacteria bacterium]|nr:fumarylacetoacetate hydrolase family protein [Pseudomonadales bacterium]MCP5346770.1 fumarylacetoacetate hydrolase family protein [Pseudomonadales bacterium]
MNYLFTPSITALPLRGSESLVPVHRIYCVGKNYADHAREMGGDPEREPPCFFSKPADAAVYGQSSIPFPSHTGDLHYEVELVVVIGKEGANVSVEQAAEMVLGYAVGIDLTRRDLQAEAKAAGRPWDVAKGFDNSAPVSVIYPVSEVGLLERGEISLSVNGELRQQGDIGNMTWGIPAIIAELSGYFMLKPGDLIFTGTPAGVGSLRDGDQVEARIAGLGSLQINLG